MLSIRCFCNRLTASVSYRPCLKAVPGAFPTRSRACPCSASGCCLPFTRPPAGNKRLICTAHATAAAELVEAAVPKALAVDFTLLAACAQELQAGWVPAKVEQV